MFTSDGKSDVEIRRRLALGKQKIIELQFIWKSPSLSLPTKFRFVRSIVLATVLYGCQSWTLSVSSMLFVSAVALSHGVFIYFCESFPEANAGFIHSCNYSALFAIIIIIIWPLANTKRHDFLNF